MFPQEYDLPTRPTKRSSRKGLTYYEATHGAVSVELAAGCAARHCPGAHRALHGPGAARADEDGRARRPSLFVGRR
jgi:hypothetical protein